MRVAIIPARANSKRIVGKCIKAFNGKPIIAWSILAAIESKCFDKVIVSTDSEAISQVAKDYGAETPFVRPAELADDFTPIPPVITHAIKTLCQSGLKLDHVCCVYATAPLLQPEFLRQGLAALSADSANQYAFSATRFSFPIQRALRQLPTGGVAPFDAKSISMRSQDLEEAFHDAGQFVWGTSDAWLNNAPIFAPTSRMIVLPNHLVQDIDTLEDWHRAELLHRLILQGEASENSISR